MSLDDISIHKNFHQNRSINKCARMILTYKWSYLKKSMHLHNVNILEKFYKDWALNKKYVAEKEDFEILR